MTSTLSRQDELTARQMLAHPEKLGHELVRVNIPRVDEIIGAFYEYVAAEGDLKGYREILEGEDMIQ